MSNTAKQTPQSAWSQWRQNRDEELRADHGWLTPVALNWLGETPAKIDEFPGQWSYENGRVKVHFGVESGVRKGDKAAARNEEFTLEPGQTNREFSYGEKQAEVAFRGERVMVRVRDNAAQLRREFAGISCFDYDPRYVVKGKLHRLNKVQEVKIGTSQDDYNSSAKVFALVAFSLPGTDPSDAQTRFGFDQVLRLTGDEKDAKLIFHDHTNGGETAAWRAVRVKVNGDDTVEIDFNYATIFPGHMTPFGTCPRPVPGNTIEGEVRAGEKVVTRNN